MSDHDPITHEEQVRLVQGAQQRMDAVARSWLEDPKVKAVLLGRSQRPQDQTGRVCRLKVQVNDGIIKAGEIGEIIEHHAGAYRVKFSDPMRILNLPLSHVEVII